MLGRRCSDGRAKLSDNGSQDSAYTPPVKSKLTELFIELFTDI